MTTYTDHADELFDTDAPVLGPTHLEARDNLLSVCEGDESAPNVSSRGVALRVGIFLPISPADGTTLCSVDAGYVGKFTLITVGKLVLTATVSGDSDIILEASKNATDWDRLFRKILVGPTSTDPDENVVEVSGYVWNSTVNGAGEEYRYFRWRATGDSDHDFSTDSAASIVFAETELT